MDALKFLVLVFFTLVLNRAATAQDTCWTALLLKEGHSVDERKNMTSVDPDGFYLYRDCIYNIQVNNKAQYAARLINIRPDMLIFLSHFNPAVAKKYNQSFDTLVLHFKTITKLSLIADRSFGMYTSISMKNYNITFQQDTIHCGIPVSKLKIYEGDTTLHEVLPILTQQGLDYLFEEGGKTYYYRGPIKKAIRQDSVFKKRKVGIFPSFNDELDQVNGFALEFFATGANQGDTLKEKGFILELFPLGLFGPFFGSFLGKDSIVFSMEPDPTTLEVNGFYVSAGGCLAEAEIKGFYIGGAMTIVNSLSGFIITGVHTRTYAFKGLCISALRNQAKVGRGVQIALFNSSMNFKGIQIGLWNKNQKRSLPFINWNFKDK
jgi:hypothetical protein